MNELVRSEGFLGNRSVVVTGCLCLTGNRVPGMGGQSVEESSHAAEMGIPCLRSDSRCGIFTQVVQND